MPLQNNIEESEGFYKFESADVMNSEHLCSLYFVYRIVLYCIVVGSRRLMPPDALQPKAYFTNPGL